MPHSNGDRTSDLTSVSLIDDLLGNREGTTVRITAEALITLISARLGPAKKLRSTLLSDLNWNDGAVGSVFGDTPERNGVYLKSGDQGSGSWTWIGDLPVSSATIAMLAEKADVTSLGAESDLRAAGDANNATLIASLASGDIRIIGAFDASSGGFPTGATAGNIFRVSAAGMVDGVAFAKNDTLTALASPPSSTTYAGNWLIGENSDVLISADVQPFQSLAELIATSFISVGQRAQIAGRGEYVIAAAGSYAVDGINVIDLVGISGQAVSTSLNFDSVADLYADTRPIAFLRSIFGSAGKKTVRAGDVSFTLDLAQIAAAVITTAGGVNYEPYGQALLEHFNYAFIGDGTAALDAFLAAGHTEIFLDGRVLGVSTISLSGPIVINGPGRVESTDHAFTVSNGAFIKARRVEFVADGDSFHVKSGATWSTDCADSESKPTGIAISYEDSSTNTLTKFLWKDGSHSGAQNGFTFRDAIIGDIRVDGVTIENNTAPSGVSGGQNIQGALLAGTVTSLESFIVTGCHIQDITSPYGSADTNHECQGISLLPQTLTGRAYIEITDNRIINVKNIGREDAEGIYCKTPDAFIDGNKLSDSGGKQGSINVKKTALNAVVANNLVHVDANQTEQIAGIYSESRMIVIDSNVTRNTTGFAISTLPSTEDTNTAVIATNNIALNTRARVGILSRNNQRTSLHKGNICHGVSGEFDGAPNGFTTTYRRDYSPAALLIDPDGVDYMDNYGMLIAGQTGVDNFVTSNVMLPGDKDNDVCFGISNGQTRALISDGLGTLAAIGVWIFGGDPTTTPPLPAAISTDLINCNFPNVEFAVKNDGDTKLDILDQGATGGGTRIKRNLQLNGRTILFNDNGTQFIKFALQLPEGNIPADPGSIIIQVDGVGAPAIWFKATGTGVTGFQQVTTV